MPRMNILNTVDREAFESPPVFNSVQRKILFRIWYLCWNLTDRRRSCQRGTRSNPVPTTPPHPQIKTARSSHP